MLDVLSIIDPIERDYRLEITSALFQLSNGSLFSKFANEVKDFARFVAVTSFQNDFHESLAQFALFADFVQKIDSKIRFDEIADVLSYFPTLGSPFRHSDGFPVVLPLLEDEPVRAMSLVYHMRAAVGFASDLRRARLIGQTSEPLWINSDSMAALSDIVRVLANPRPDSKVCALLGNEYSKTVCPTILEVAELFLHTVEVWRLHAVATMGNLCRRRSDVPARIALSLVMASPSRFLEIGEFVIVPGIPAEIPLLS